MAAIELLLQVSAATAGPITLWMARLVYRWKRETDQTVERNEEAIWGTEAPHAGWPGTVELVRSHEQRLRRLEAELGFGPAGRSPLDAPPDGDPVSGAGVGADSAEEAGSEPASDAAEKGSAAATPRDPEPDG